MATPTGASPEFDRMLALFEGALQLESDQRDAFVRREAGADTALRDRVLALVRADDAKTIALRHTMAAATGSSPEFGRLCGLLERARELPEPEREAFVRQQAAADPVLRARAVAVSRTILELLRSASAGGRPARVAGERVQSTATSELLARLEQAPKLDTHRYELEGEVDRGGMGAILRILDRHLNRRLAMKVLLEREAPKDDYEQQLAHQLLGRFLEEAQVTSQLDHPGVVPVHELGLDPAGRVYFTMRLVKGRTAHEVFAESHAGSPDWPLTRALEIVLKVCDTMAFAHDKGVLHRDLKPGNVMVGRFGEVYVMDWGLAKVLGQEDRRDVRIRPRPVSAISRIDSVRRRDTDSDELASVVSMDGQKLGTPCYMPPEQARSEPLDVRADVYAIGAMLYELSTGRAPYTSPGITVDAYRILKEVNDGPPKRIEELKQGVPAELVAICDKAMARDREQRYANTAELAADLRAFLAQRAVKAYRTGAIVELKLWVRRNKPLAASLLAAVAILIGGIGGTSWLANENAALARQKTALAAEVQEAATALGREVRKFVELSGVVRYERALRDEADLYPGWPDKVAAMDAWLADTDELLATEPQLRETVAELSTRALPPTAAEIEAGLRSRARAGELDAPQDELRPRRFGSSRDEQAAGFLHGALTALLGRFAALREKRTDVLRRRNWANRIGGLTLAHPHRGADWADVRAGIAASGKYAGCEIPLADADVIRNWLGLVPLGENPVTHYQEFYELRSAWDGEADPAQIPIPRHAADGSIGATADAGIVFVLLPGGTVTLGSRADNEGAPHHDPQHRSNEALHTVTLAPFLLARHELTQGQWARLCTWDASLRDPSQYGSGRANLVGGTISAANPVESVDWTMCDLLLTRHGMVLPTEAQWEYACRGGTTTPWIVPRDQLRTVANLADADARRVAPDWTCESWPDGHALHAPVGSFLANDFGLHDVHGNVWEWCRDWYGDYGSERAGDGLRTGGPTELRVNRGGSYYFLAVDARSANRYASAPSVRYNSLGLRAARLVRP